MKHVTQAIIDPLERRLTPASDLELCEYGSLDGRMRDPNDASSRYDHTAFKMVAVVSSKLDAIVAANTVGHMLVALGARVGPWLLGMPRADADGLVHAPLVRYPLIVLTARPGKIAEIVAEARTLRWLSVVDYPEQGYTTTHDDDYGEAMAGRHSANLLYIGAAIFGPESAVNPVTGRLSLWRPNTP